MRGKKEKKQKIGFPVEKSRRRAFYIIMTPFIVLFLIYRLFPMIWGFYISMTNYSGFNIDSMKFVGFDNYKNVFYDTQALPALGRTLLIGIVVIPLSIIICNIMAILLSMKNMKATGLFRTLFYIPSIIPAVAVGTMWRGMFLRDGGVVNEVVKLLGGEPVNWMGYEYAFYSLVIMMLWGAGSGVLNHIAAIKNISSELLEAARLDGAGTIQLVTKIILPLSAPMNYMALVTGVISSLQLFGQPICSVELVWLPYQSNHCIYIWCTHTSKFLSTYDSGMVWHLLGLCSLLW